MEEEKINANPECTAQDDYDQKIALLQGLYKGDHCSFEVAAHTYLGDNSLKLLANKFGEYDAGWIDDIEYSELVRNRLLAFTRQDVVATNAVAKSNLRTLYGIEKRLKVVLWLTGILVLINVFLLSILLGQ